MEPRKGKAQVNHPFESKSANHANAESCLPTEPAAIAGPACSPARPDSSEDISAEHSSTGETELAVAPPPVRSAKTRGRRQTAGTRFTRRTLLLAATTAAAAAAQTRPNILLLLGDNWAAPHASAYGDPVVRTPVFDSLAKAGALFVNAFAPNPSCSPSRSSLLTGQETHRLGSGANLYGELDPRYPTYTAALAKAGYFVGFSEKGWGPGRANPNPAGSSFKDFPAFLEAAPKDKPWCFWFGSHDPHVPWNRGEGTPKPAIDKIRVPAYIPDTPETRADIRDYYSEVQQFDHECGEHLARIDADKTLVVMTSDNGWQIPRGLANCYDSGVRIPMAIRWPGRIRPGTRRNDFVSIYDLAPTFVEAAGLAVPKEMTARSLLRDTGREHMFVERERHANVRRGDLTYPVRGIRTRDWLYLWNLEPDRWPAGDPELYWAVGPYGDIDPSRSKTLLMEKRTQPYFDLCFGKRPPEELYDLRSDPDQVKNLASDPAHASTRQRFRQRVEEWMRASSDPRASGPTDVFDKVPYTGARANDRGKGSNRTQPLR
jgi:arylsulfatase A-like enzyme